MTHSQTHGLPEWPRDALEEFRAATTLAGSAAAYVRAAAGIDYLDSLLVLGTGWRGALEGLLGTSRSEPSTFPASADGVDVLWRADATTVPGFTEALAAENHAELIVVRLGDEADAEPDDGIEGGHDARHVLIHTGRPHVYDGFGVHAPAHSVRVAAALGAERVILTSDCGALRDDYAPGTTLLVRDHVNPTFTTPLVGPAFVDLRGMWSLNLAELAHEHEPSLRDACFAFVPGPQYQTPSEIRLLRGAGADCVGMSTVPEALAARERGLEIVGLSIVSSAETVNEPNDPQAVLREAKRVASGHAGLLRHLLLAD